MALGEVILSTGTAVAAEPFSRGTSPLPPPGAFAPSRWYGALIGSLLALPALEDLAFAAAVASDGEQALHMAAETHPPVGDRIGQIVKFVRRFPPPGDDALEVGHPAGLIGQAAVYWTFLAASR